MQMWTTATPSRTQKANHHNYEHLSLWRSTAKLKIDTTVASTCMKTTATRLCHEDGQCAKSTIQEPTGRLASKSTLETTLVKPVLRPGLEVGRPQRYVHDKHTPHQVEQMAV